MKWQYWCPRKDHCPAENQVQKDLKNNRPARRVFDDRLEDLEGATYEQCVHQGWIKPIKGSKHKLLEWVIRYPNGTARMFLVLYEDCYWFLHFFIKKSTNKIKTPPKEIEVAEDKAKMFWDTHKNK